MRGIRGTEIRTKDTYKQDTQTKVKKRRKGGRGAAEKHIAEMVRAITNRNIDNAKENRTKVAASPSLEQSAYEKGFIDGANRIRDEIVDALRTATDCANEAVSKRYPHVKFAGQRKSLATIARASIGLIGLEFTDERIRKILQENPKPNSQLVSKNGTASRA